jgi:glycosyltransferase involved in cell wall biosynthesis
MGLDENTMRILVILEDYIRDINAENIVHNQHKYSAGMTRLKVFEKISEKIEQNVYIYGNIAAGECGGLQTINKLSVSLKPDVIIFNNAPKLKTLLRIYKNFPKCRKIIWFGNPIHHYMFSYLYLNLVDHFVCVSKYHKRLYENYKIKDRISVIYSGTNLYDVSRAPKKKKDNQYLWISAPVKSKGITNLFPLWKNILSINPQAKLDIFGSLALHGSGSQGIFEPDVEALADEFLSDKRVSGSVRLRGWVERDVLFKSIESARYCIVNLNYEGSYETFCCSAVEAQQLGSFVIGGNYGSLPEVTQPGINSILLDKVDFHDDQTLQTKLQQKLYTKHQISTELTSLTLSADAWLETIRQNNPNYKAPSVRDVFYILATAIKYAVKNRYSFQKAQ